MIILFEPSFRESYYEAPESDISLRYYKLKELGSQNIRELTSRPELMAEAGFLQRTSHTTVTRLSRTLKNYRSLCPHLTLMSAYSYMILSYLSTKTLCQDRLALDSWLF